VTTGELNEALEKMIAAAGGYPSFKGYGEPIPFPAGLCASVNEQIVHGIPGKRVLQAGDIVGLDVGMEKEGLFTDLAVTVSVGKESKLTHQLLKVTRHSLELGIAKCRVGNTLGDIGFAIQSYVEKKWFSGGARFSWSWRRPCRA
jgi:methionyl aminopeptidase